MAIERRVKPSARMKEEMNRRRKPMIIGAVALVAVLAIAAIGVVVVPKILDSSVDSPGSSSVDSQSGVKTEAIKALLERSVSYTGAWYDDPNGLFQVYLPGNPYTSEELLNSVVMHKSVGEMGAYGVTIGDTQLYTLEGDPTKDPTTVFNTVFDKTLPDISHAMYGNNFGGAYDLTSLVLNDGTKAVYVSGDLQTVMGLKDEGSDVVTETVMNFPLRGFVVLREDWPVFIWSVADPDDSGTANSLDTYMRECASIFSSNISDGVETVEGTESTEQE